jgi:hypothetical protein
VKLADYAVEKSLSPAVARTEIENALAADDADLAASFLTLAHDSARNRRRRDRSPVGRATAQDDD